uniref:Choline/ethanolamine kinase n=1 Tax=Caenorhabditis tropicalis TaxID=1561998 RepID=A0A1I7UQN0_9PELO
MNQELINFFSTLSENSLNIRKKALEYGRDYLGGEWKSLTENDVDVVQMTGGQSNLLYLVTSSPGKISYESTPSCFLIRLHCQQENQVFTDTVVFSIMSERQLGPKLYGFFPGGRLEQFLPSITLDNDTVSIPEVAKKIGANLPKLHAIEVPIPKKPKAILMIREFLEECRSTGNNVFKLVSGSVQFNDSEIPKEVTIDKLEEEVTKFEKMCSIFDETVVFSHNDLWSANILQLNETKDIVFIDFEYSSYNWRSFDLSMHLSECAFDYRVPFPPGVHVNQIYFENHPNIRIFCEAYIDSLYKMKKENPNQKYPLTDNREKEISRLIQECKFFLPLVNMLWATWSIKNLWAGKQDDVDLTVAASNRLSVFFHFKSQSERIYNELKNE